MESLISESALSRVEALLFKTSGKYAYTVLLDYSGFGQARFDSWNLWQNAIDALRAATQKGISRVSLSEIPPGWVLVVAEPWGRHACPILVPGPAVRSEIADAELMQQLLEDDNAAVPG